MRRLRQDMSRRSQWPTPRRRSKQCTKPGEPPPHTRQASTPRPGARSLQDSQNHQLWQALQLRWKVFSFRAVASPHSLHTEPAALQQARHAGGAPKGIGAQRRQRSHARSQPCCTLQWTTPTSSVPRQNSHALASQLPQRPLPMTDASLQVTHQRARFVQSGRAHTLGSAVS